MQVPRCAGSRTVAWVRGPMSARGVTLFEVLVVLALIAVAGGVASPHVAALRRGLAVRSGALVVASTLAQARYGALAEGRPWHVRVRGPSLLESGPTGARLAPVHLPSGVRVLAATSGGDVRFRPTGWAENATFRVGYADEQRLVVVNQRGRISVRVVRPPDGES